MRGLGRSGGRLLLCATLVVSLSGCLGTWVETRQRSTKSYATLQIHLLAAPALIRADVCQQGLAEVATYVPLWGLVVGFFTIGIVVPQWTVYSCVQGS